MSVFPKNNVALFRFFVLLLLGVMGTLANATIILQSDAPEYEYAIRWGRFDRGMPTVLLMPRQAGSQAAYLAQRSRGWYAYGRQGTGSGLPLVMTPMAGVAGDVSERQIRARNHVAQANAYRLRFYGR